jgi:hypothetical protein
MISKDRKNHIGGASDRNAGMSPEGHPLHPEHDQVYEGIHYKQPNQNVPKAWSTPEGLSGIASLTR